MVLFSKRSKQEEAEEEALPIVVEGATWSAQGDSELPAYTQEGGSHTCHIYKANGAWSNDLLVSSASKDKVLYYFRLPSTLSHAWNPKDALLYEGYKGGPIVASFDKPNMFKRSDIKVEWFAGSRVGTSESPASDPTKFTLSSTQKLGDDHEFQVGDPRFKWLVPLASNMTLIDLHSNEQAAVFDESFWSKKKAGKLTISPTYLPHLELIIITAVALDRHRSQKRAERAAASSGGGGG